MSRRNFFLFCFCCDRRRVEFIWKKTNTWQMLHAGLEVSYFQRLPGSFYTFPYLCVALQTFGQEKRNRASRFLAHLSSIQAAFALKWSQILTYRNSERWVLLQPMIRVCDCMIKFLLYVKGAVICRLIGSYTIGFSNGYRPWTKRKLRFGVACSAILSIPGFHTISQMGNTAAMMLRLAVPSSIRHFSSCDIQCSTWKPRGGL